VDIGGEHYKCMNMMTTRAFISFLWRHGEFGAGGQRRRQSLLAIDRGCELRTTTNGADTPGWQPISIQGNLCMTGMRSLMGLMGFTLHEA